MSILGDDGLIYNSLYNEKTFAGNVNGSLIVRGTLTANRIRDTGLTANKFVASDSSNNLVSQTVQGTANQIILTGTVGSTTLTLSTPQDIDVSANVTFDSLNLSSLTPSMPVKTDVSNNLVSSLIDLTTDISGTLNVSHGGTNSSSALTNGYIMVSSGGAIVEGTSSSTPFTFGDTVTVSNTSALLYLKTPVAGTGLAALVWNEGIIPRFRIMKDFSTGTRHLNITSFESSATGSNINIDGSIDLLTAVTIYGADNSVKLFANVPSTSTTTGTLKVSGGIGLTGDLYGTNANFSGLSISMPVKTNTSKQLVSSAISLVSDITGTLNVINGGTSSSTALTNGCLMVSSGGAIVEGTSSSSPTFTGVNLSGLTASRPVKTDSSKNLTSGSIVLTTDISGILPVANGGTNSSSTLTNGKIMVSSGGAVVEGTSSSTPTFTSETLTATTNQLVLGTTRTITLTAPTPATTSRTYTMPDCASDASFVMTELAQTINGAKTLSGITTVSNTTDSTSTTTGGLVVSGGLGVAKQLRCADNVTISNAKSLRFLDASGNNRSVISIDSGNDIRISGGTGALYLANDGTANLLQISYNSSINTNLYYGTTQRLQVNSTGISIGTTSGTAGLTLQNNTGSYTPAVLNYYETWTGTLQLTMSGNNVSLTTKVDAVRVGGSVIITFYNMNNFTTTGASTKMVGAAGSIPSRFCFTNYSFIEEVYHCVYGATRSIGLGRIYFDGGLEFYPDTLNITTGWGAASNYISAMSFKFAKI